MSPRKNLSQKSNPGYSHAIAWLALAFSLLSLIGAGCSYVSSLGRLNATIPSTASAAITPTSTIADVLDSSPDFFTFSAALKSAGMFDMLRNGGPYLVLAPDNNAFNALSTSTIQSLLGVRNIGNLVRMLSLHIIPLNPDLTRWPVGQPLRTLDNELLSTAGVTNTPTLMIDGVLLDAPAIHTANGAIYSIHQVLPPPQHSPPLLLAPGQSLP